MAPTRQYRGLTIAPLLYSPYLMGLSVGIFEPVCTWTVVLLLVSTYYVLLFLQSFKSSLANPSSPSSAVHSFESAVYSAHFRYVVSRIDFFKHLMLVSFFTAQTLYY